MKPTSSLRSFLALTGSALLTISYAHATNLYWDSNSTTSGAGATPTGTWGVDNFWNTDLTGANLGAFQTATLGTDDLFFSAGTDAVNPYTIGLNSATQLARLVTFEDGTVTLDTGTLSLGTNGGLTVTSGTVTGATISSNLTITGAQTFTVAAGRILTLDTGAFTRNAGATLNVLSTGTVTTTMTNLSSGSLVNGIIGPWASFGSGASTKYATIDGSNNIVGLTGTAAATAANVTSVAGTFNYDVAAVGTLGAGANINTLRYTGAAGTIAGALTTNGIMNTGGNALVFSGAMTSGTGEMVLHAANGALTFSGGLNNNGNMVSIAGSGNVSFGATANIITGAGGITMNGTGTLTLNGGGTQASHNFSGPLTLNNGRVLSYFNGGASNGGLGAGNFTINNGLYVEYWNSTFNRTLGAGAGQFQILGGTSGFVQGSAAGLTVTLNNSSAFEVVWGSAFFNPTTLSLQDSAPTNSNLTFSNLLDLNGTTRTIYVNNATNASATLSNVIRTSSGTAGLIKTGTGYMALTAANTYNGATTINGGMLDATTFANVNTNSSIGKGSVGGSAADLVINGGTLRHSAANVATTNRLFSIGTSGGTIDSSAASATNLLNFNGSGAMGFNSQLGTRTLTLGGSNTGNNNMGVLIGDDGSANATSVTKTGAGLWILSNASNSYTGPTTLTGGTLSVGVAGNLGAASSNLVFNGGTLQITGTTLTNFASLGRTVSFNSGQTVGLDINNASNVFTVDQTLNQGTGGLIKAGAGTLVINSAHTYTGTTTISAGTLRIDTGGSIAGSLINNGVFLVNQNATAGTGMLSNIAGAGSIAAGSSATITINTPTGLQFNALNTTGGGSFALSGVITPTFGGLSGTTGNLSSAFSSGYSGVTSLTLNTAANNIAGNSFTYGGVIDDGAAGMDLTKTGAGTQTLTGNNAYTGETYLNGGTLAIGSGSTIGKISGTTGLTFNGGTLQFNRSTNANITAIPDGAPITVNSSSTFGVTSADAGGVSANETIGAVTLNAGQMNFNWTNGASSGAQMILSGLSRSGTASAAFNGTLGSTGRWKVTGAGSTTAGQIIGPWYTTGAANAGFASTDYAVFGSDFIAAANIAGSAETTWTTAANAYTMSANQTLTGTRTITALRNTFVTSPQLTLASGFNLETYGVLNGAANATLTIAPGTGGVLTTPTGGGNLYLASGPGGTGVPGAITVSAPINNNGGNVTLVKNGSGTLTLTSTTSNFSGGVVLNAGTLSIDDVRSIGGTNNTGGSTAPITVNGSSTISMPTNNLTANFGTGAITIAQGATLTVNGASRPNLIFGGAVTGDGGVTALSGSFWAKYSFNSTSNAFTGAITDSRSGNDGIANALFSFNSIADGAGYGNIILNGANDSGIDYGSGATAALTLNNRQIVLANNNTVFFNNASSQAVNINTDIGFSGTGARQIRFGITGRSGAGVSTIAGKLTDNVGGAFTPTFNGGTWVVPTSTNSYTGTTGVNGTANVTLSGNNTLTGQITISGNGVLTLSGNNSGMTGNVVLSTNTSNNPRLNINSATALGTGILNFGGGAATDVVQIDNTSVGTINVSTANAITMNRNFTFVGTQDLSLGTGTTTLGGMTSGTNRSITVTAKTLTLNGTIAEATTNLGITKAGAGTLVLSGTGNSYTGATTVSAGTLAGVGANAFGSTSGISIAAASSATLSLRGDSSTSFVKTSDSSLYSVTTTANGATINVDQATIAGTGAKTMTIGTLALNNAVTNGTNFTGANNTSLSIGAVTTAAAASGVETLTNNISGGGILTLASLAVSRTGTPEVVFNGTGNTTVTGAISQAATTKLTKSGAGILTLEGVNGYTGATAVNAGTLEIALGGSTHASSAVTISNSGSALVVNGTVNGTLVANASTTLSGSGTVNGAATVSGNLNPGNSPGLITFNSSLALANTTATTMEIAGTNLGINYDAIDASGALTYDGALTLALGATFGAGSYTFNLFDFGSQTGSFDSIALTGLYTGAFTNSLGVWSATTNAGNETWTFTQSTGDLSLTVIPEPRAALLGALGMLMLLRRRRN